MLVLLEHYSGYVYYALVLIVLIIISLLPFKKAWVFKALFRFSIVLGTLFVFVNQLGSEMRSHILRGKGISIDPLLNVTLMIAINNILKACADVAETVIEGISKKEA